MLIYEELLDALELEEVSLVGLSYGGMVASEIAAQLRRRIRQLILVSPLGLWRDDAPVRQYMLDAPEDLMSSLVVDFLAEEKQAFGRPQVAAG